MIPATGGDFMKFSSVYKHTHTKLCPDFLTPVQLHYKVKWSHIGLLIYHLPLCSRRYASKVEVAHLFGSQLTRSQHRSPEAVVGCHTAGSFWLACVGLEGQWLSSVAVLSRVRAGENSTALQMVPPGHWHAHAAVSINKEVICLLCHPALILTSSLHCPLVLSPSPLQTETAPLKVRLVQICWLARHTGKSNYNNEPVPSSYTDDPWV